MDEQEIETPEPKPPLTDAEFRQKWANASEDEKATARRAMGASGL